MNEYKYGDNINDYYDEIVSDVDDDISIKTEQENYALIPQGDITMSELCEVLTLLNITIDKRLYDNEVSPELQRHFARKTS